jgi:HSP20 family molecular chaperone IbpA
MLDATQPRRDDQKPDLPRSIPSGLWTGCLVSFGEASVSRHSGTWSNRRFGQIRAPTSPPRRSSSREDEKTCQLTAELPGLSEKDINLTVSDDLLIVTGEKREEKELDEKNYHYSERRFGSFRRAVQLPQHVNRDKIEGELQERRARCEAAEDARRDAASAQDRGQRRVVLLPLDEWLDVGRCHQSNAMTQTSRRAPGGHTPSQHVVLPGQLPVRRSPVPASPRSPQTSTRLGTTSRYLVRQRGRLPAPQS